MQASQQKLGLLSSRPSGRGAKGAGWKHEAAFMLTSRYTRIVAVVKVWAAGALSEY